MIYIPLKEKTTAELQEIFDHLRKTTQKLNPATDEFWEVAKIQQEVAKILDSRLGNKKDIERLR
jgi:hypothetical protein